MNCRICGRKTSKKYCKSHEKAYENLIQKYEDWKRAKDISWKKYLGEVVNIPFTGSWAKEVAENLISGKGLF